MLTHNELAQACITIASHPRKTFRVFSERAHAEVLQLWRERLVSVRFTRDGLMFRLTALGQDIARDFHSMTEA